MNNRIILTAEVVKMEKRATRHAFLLDREYGAKQNTVYVVETTTEGDNARLSRHRAPGR